MKLYLIDDFDSKEINIIKKTLQSENSKFAEIDDFDVEDDFISNPDLNTVCVIAKIENNFFTKDMFKFIKELLKKKINQKFDVVLVEKFGDNSKIAVDWLVSLKTDYLLNMSVIGEFNLENLSEELENLNKIQPNIKVLFNNSTSNISDNQV